MRRAALATIVFNLMLAAALFLSAGRLDWPMGWAMIGFFVVVGIVGFLILPSELIVERSSGQPDARLYDVVVAGLGGLFLYPITFAFCGLDFRFGWSPQLPLLFRSVAFGLCVVGYAFSMWAARSNPFFSTVVRVQRERNHHAIDRGPYALVRHPGYAGAILAHVVLPVALGCLWGLIAAVIGITLLVLRTTYEDERLANELEGYREYQQRVGWRLFPGVW